VSLLVDGAGPVNQTLIVFADDWGRHPSSSQHLVKHLLDEHRVVWVNTIGTRTPQLNLQLLQRGIEKVRQWGRQRQDPSGPRPEGRTPEVHNPVMYPGFRNSWQRRVNASLISGYLKRHVGVLSDAVVLSAVPITADLPARLQARRWVYYCVDDFSAWPGLDSAPLQAMERELVRRADRVVAAGDNLAARLAAMGRSAEVVAHGIDLEHWNRDASGDASVLGGLPGPIALFWGLVDRRLDLEFLRALDRRMTAGSIVIVGPQQDFDPALRALSRVRLLGAVDYEQLPALAKRAAVLLMPYADLAVTRAMQPLKLKEYLATGRPVVAARLPAVQAWSDCLDTADDAEDFAAKVLARMDSGTPAEQLAARGRLKNESWQAKSQRLAEILFGD